MTETAATEEFMVVMGQIVGSPADWTTAYHCDGQRFPSREKAVSHGWEVHGHDDWLILRLRGGRAAGLSWMDEERDDPEELAKVAAALSLGAVRPVVHRALGGRRRPGRNPMTTSEETEMTETTTTVPTLTTAEEAHNLLRQLAEDNDWVSVFWDRGWGDSGQKAEISIIVGGNGQQPKAWITPEVYRDLRERKIVAPNSLKTYKARRVHDFRTPEPEERTGPDPAAAAEPVIRGVLGELHDISATAQFYRGLDPDSHTPRVQHEHVYTAAYDGRGYVNLSPGARDAVVTAWGRPTVLGPDRIGEAEIVRYPMTDAGEVDKAALRGALTAAIRAKAAGVGRPEVR